jgi:hypothetical protein
VVMRDVLGLWRMPTRRPRQNRDLVCQHCNMRDSTEPITPTLRQVVLNCEDARALAEFYRQLLGFQYRPGDEPPADGTPHTQGQEWLVLHDGHTPDRVPTSALSARGNMA